LRRSIGFHRLHRGNTGRLRLACGVQLARGAGNGVRARSETLEAPWRFCRLYGPCFQHRICRGFSARWRPGPVSRAMVRNGAGRRANRNFL